MAETDPLTLFPTTTPTTSGGAANDDDPLKLFPTEAPNQSTKPSDMRTAMDMPASGSDLPAWMLKGGDPDKALPIFPKPAAGAVGRILEAGKEGAANAPQLFSGTTMGDYVYNPLLAAAGGVFRGGQQLVNEAISPLNPQLGRDVAALPEAFPTGDYGQPAGPTTAGQARNALNQPVTLDDLTSAIRRSDAAAASGGPAPAAPPAAAAPPSGAAVPTDAGAAAAPPRLVNITPAEEAMYRNSADGNKLLENQQIGQPDTNTYIPNVTPNQAELEQTVNAAREMKSLGIQSTEASQDAKLAAQDNNEARVQYWKDTRGSDADAFREKAQQQADINSDKQTVFAPGNIKGDVDMAPVVQQIDDTLAMPVNRQNTALQTVFGDLRKRLVDNDGNPLSMGPEEAWGLRQDIDRMTSKRMQADDPNLHYVAHDMSNVAGTIDTGINNMAPGYNDMLATYAAHASKLDEMGLLKDAEINKGLFRGPTQQMNYNDFQRFMKNVVDARSTPATDLNPYKSITDDTMQRLWNIRDDLRRSAGAQELARAPGSDTAPNIIDVLKRYGSQAAIHGVANAISPGWGTVVVRGLQEATAPYRAARAEAGIRARMQQMLNPNPLNQPPTPSPLNPPP